VGRDAAKSVFELFRMTMPEQYIRDVVLPAKNVFLTETLMISEFYKWLGCHFFNGLLSGRVDQMPNNKGSWVNHWWDEMRRSRSLNCSG
jgi:hypothetical protein